MSEASPGFTPIRKPRFPPGGVFAFLPTSHRLSAYPRHADGAQWPDQTESLATFSGDALTDLLAGFAANCIGSLVKGLTPMRASVAGLFTTDIFAKPGMTNSPDSFSSL